MFCKLTIFVGALAVAVAAPNHLKTVVVDTSGVGGGNIGATASLAVEAVPAKAVIVEAPVHTVPAVTSGGHASAASASSGGHAGVTVSATAAHSGPSFFDRIFNIPISILHSVNDHLNTRGPVKGVVVTAGGHGGVVPVAEEHVAVGGTTAVASASTGVSAATVSDVGLRTGAGHAGGGHATVVVGAQKNPAFYDSVFNIPITALKSVNQLLNG